MAPAKLPKDVEEALTGMSGALNSQIAARLIILCIGILFANGRRSVTSWLRAAGVGPAFRLYYYTLGSIGRNTQTMATLLLLRLVRWIPLGDSILLAIDDTPTKRYGRRVEGAGLHHNPTPGPAQHKFLFGHVWVTLALIAVHPCWGVIALPLLARLYVRVKNLGSIALWNRPRFQTKLEQAADLLAWAAGNLRFLGKPIRVVVDGGYVRRTFLKRAAALQVTVIGRLRKDAALYSVPNYGASQRGRKRKYGRERISLVKRAGHRHGWVQGDFTVYGKTVSKTYKTFLATYPPVGGLIRVVLIKEADGWLPLFSTDPNLTAQEIIEDFARRNSLEQTFKDLKQVYGAGQQQVRHWFANLGAFHLNAWMFTLTEAWGWTRSHGDLCDRSRSPWDKQDRRPSHADRRNSMRRHALREAFSTLCTKTPLPRKFRQALETLITLAA